MASYRFKKTASNGMTAFVAYAVYTEGEFVGEVYRDPGSKLWQVSGFGWYKGKKTRRAAAVECERLNAMERDISNRRDAK